MKCVWTTRKDNVKLFSAFLVEMGQVLKPQVEREQAGSKRGEAGALSKTPSTKQASWKQVLGTIPIFWPRDWIPTL